MIGGKSRDIAEELVAGGVPFVEATVVRAQRPTSVRAGDSAIVHQDGAIEGFVGGLCAEASVRLHALRVLETGDPLLLRILPGDDAEEPSAIDGAVTVKNPCLSGGALEIFLQPRVPAATIRVVGESPIAIALVDLGRRLGYAVERGAGDMELSADDAALVVASHGRDEEIALSAALREGVPYVGLVASEVRGEAVRSSLDVPEELRSQLRTPAGLEIGAHTPEEIALAILAEIVAGRSDQAGRQATADPGAASSPGAKGAATPTAPPKQVKEPSTGTVAEAGKPPTKRRRPATEVAVDPICGMEVAVSAASIHLDLDGERYYFCSEGCRETFAAQGADHAGTR